MTEIERAIAEIVGTNYGECQCHIETMVLAAKALTEQSERSKGCEWCNSKARFVLVGGKFVVQEKSLWEEQGKDYMYCPMCGRKLKDDNP